MCYGLHDLSMVTTNSAPRVDILVEYAPLFIEHFRAVPNSKLPPKFHTASVLEEHKENGPTFCGSVIVSVQADVWAFHIRNTAVKYRELVQSSAKMAIVERAAGRISHHPFNG